MNRILPYTLVLSGVLHLPCLFFLSGILSSAPQSQTIQLSLLASASVQSSSASATAALPLSSAAKPTSIKPWQQGKQVHLAQALRPAPPASAGHKDRERPVKINERRPRPAKITKSLPPAGMQTEVVSGGAAARSDSVRHAIATPESRQEPGPLSTVAPGQSVASAQQELAALRALIMRNLQFPASARRLGLSGQLTVSFLLQKNGEVRDIMIRTSSGTSLLDNAVIRTIRRLSPFPKPRTQMTLVIPIVYRLR